MGVRRPHHGAALVVAIGVCAALATPALGAGFGVPIPSAAIGKGVRWSRPAAEPSVHDALAARLRAARDRSDSLSAWGSALTDSLVRPVVLRRLAALQLVSGDSAGADASWAALSRERSIWHWEAVSARADLAQARGATAQADSVLAGADRNGWPDAERAAWLACRVRLRLAVGDTAGALTFSGQMLARYPGSSWSTESLAILEAVRGARGDSLSADEESLAAEVDRLRGRRESAAARLTRLASRAPGSSAIKPYLRLARVQRELRRFDEARAAAVAGLGAALTSDDTLTARLEDARALRDAGKWKEAFAAYGAAEAATPRSAGVIWRERARFLEERGDWMRARDDYARLVVASGGSDVEASLRAGLMSFAVGDSAAAQRWLARGDSDAMRFWRGVALRRARRPEPASGLALRRPHSVSGDSILRVLASMPGYSFYRVAARETLGVRGWPAPLGTIPAAPPDPAVRLARVLDDLGCTEEATQLLDRWAAADTRLSPAGKPEMPSGRPVHASLEAAAAAYAAGRPRQAIRLVGGAVARLETAPDSLRWAVSPWLYPPAYDSLFAAWPESAAAGRIDRALLQAVAWKESHFDPLARSRSDAIGLLQLKRQAVIDVARLFREPAPSDSALADPALNLRYGARYLERMLERFGRDLPLALAAYNAGPTVAKRWTRLRALGGDALACEEIDFPETQDYVKTILAVRQAYRELRPSLAP